MARTPLACILSAVTQSCAGEEEKGKKPVSCAARIASSRIEKHVICVDRLKNVANQIFACFPRENGQNQNGHS